MFSVLRVMFRWNCGPTLQEHLPTENEITRTFKPSAPLGDTVEGLGNLGKDRTKRDHVIIVGGSRNSLDRNDHNSVEKYINFIAERSSNTNSDLQTSSRGMYSLG